MISYTNYMTVNRSCYAVPSADYKTAKTILKEKIISLVYPAIGILGIAYELYLVLSPN